MFKDLLSKSSKGWRLLLQDLGFLQPEVAEASQTAPPMQQEAPQVPQMPSPSPTPTPMPQMEPRNPNWATWKRQNPKGFEELLSGAHLAAEKHGVPADMLMDISGLETSGTTDMNPPEGHTAAGYYMFNDPTVGNPARGIPASPEVARLMPEGFDRNSATSSAELTARLMKERRDLGRWAVVNGQGAGRNSLRDFYSDEELSPYLR